MEKWNFKAMKFFLIAFFVYIFLEGVLRKWVLPGGAGMIMYALKYGLLACSYICYLMLPASIKQGRVFGIQIAITSYIFLIIASSITFLGSSNGPLLSFIAIAQYCLPISLIFTIPLCVNSRGKIQTIITYTIVLSLMIYILGIMQYNSPLLSPINRYSEDLGEIARAGDKARITTVFSYITPTGDFCAWIALFCMMMLVANLDKRQYIISVLMLALSIVCAFMVGSRSVIVIILLFIVFTIGYDSILKHRIKFISIALIAAALAVIYYNAFGIPAYDTFMHRADQASYDVDTRVSNIIDFEKNMDYAGWFGKGAGITSNALQGLLTRPVTVGFEEEIGRVVLEFGIIGFIIITAIRFYILFKMALLSFSVRENNLRCLSFACTFAIVPMSFYLQLCLYNWFAYFFYFAFIGMNFAIYNIDKHERQAA